MSSWQSYLGSIMCKEYYMYDVDGQRDILFSLIPLINSCPSSPLPPIKGFSSKQRYFLIDDYCCAIICLIPAIALAGLRPFGQA